MYKTQGINHLGLSVKNLDQTVAFFTDCLGWEESGRDDSYPRSAVSDGNVRLTLWQVDHALAVNEFHFRQNVGLHHFALEVATQEELNVVPGAWLPGPVWKSSLCPNCWVRVRASIGSSTNPVAYASNSSGRATDPIALANPNLDTFNNRLLADGIELAVQSAYPHPGRETKMKQIVGINHVGIRRYKKHKSYISR
jgi:catechol 2,3-dioxygenase-like lactoylglutathione lyase family enzyme